MKFRKSITLMLTAACAFTFILASTSPSVNAQDKKEETKETDEERAARIAAFRAARGPSMAKYEQGDKTLSIQCAKLKAEGVDYELVPNVKAGDYLVLTKSNAIKLKTDFDLAFGEVKVKYGNAAPNYPGVYSVWLKKTGSGWEIAFNEKADVWGTQYDPAHDIGKSPATYSKIDLEAPGENKLDDPNKLRFALAEAGDAMELTIKFGTHQWTAPFSIEQ